MEKEKGKPSNEHWMITVHIFEVVEGCDDDLTLSKGNVFEDVVNKFEKERSYMTNLTSIFTLMFWEPNGGS